jgi:polyphosphate:AMP phosphotransferase
VKRALLESGLAARPLPRSAYEREEAKLREALLDAQYDLYQDGRFPVIVLVEGFDGAGKGETINLLNEWMDPRHIRTEAFGAPTPDEQAYPALRRYWLALPPRNQVGIIAGHWYSEPLRQRAFGKLRKPAFEQCLQRILDLERMLAAEGALLVKFWFHLTRKAQKKRLRTLERDPLTRWRIRKEDWEHFRGYDRFLKTAESMLRKTSMAHAPWLVVDSADEAYRNLAVGGTLLAAMRTRLDAAPSRPRSSRRPARMGRSADVLAGLDLALKLDRRSYEEQLDILQARLNGLSRHPRFRERSAVLVFEGPDAAGKGGAIRRVTRALDARHYHTVPVAAPTDEERAQPYLWRFWRHVPRRGRIAIFDRSWYGRVLVERVEALAPAPDWMRAYDEINEFERQLAESGAVVIKFWLAISREEQYRRFRERRESAFKRFKLTPEDWRNRAKWGAYEEAACDMIARTSTPSAPWTLVEAEDKLFGRIKVLRTICGRLEQAFDEG